MAEYWVWSRFFVCLVLDSRSLWQLVGDEDCLFDSATYGSHKYFYTFELIAGGGGGGGGGRGVMGRVEEGNGGGVSENEDKS